MKKLILTTTALATLFAGAAMADMPTVSVGGMVDFEMGMVNQKSAYREALENSPNQKKMKFRNRAKLYVGAKGKADNGVVYGAYAKLMPVAESENTFSNGKTDRTYLFVESSMGRVEMGSNFAASRLLKVSPDQLARGTGGATDGGNYLHYVNLAGEEIDQNDFTIAVSEKYILTPMNILNRTELSKESSRKITWMSPRYSGVQFGLSYAPDAANNGSKEEPFRYTGQHRAKNHLSFGLNYSNTYDNMNLAFSAVYDHAQVTDGKHKNIGGYEVGAAVGTGDFTFAASYFDDKNTLANNEGESGLEQHAWSVGAAYENGPIGASLTYMSSKAASATYMRSQSVSVEFGYSRLSAYSMSLDYKMAPGFKPYAELTFFDSKPSDDDFAKNKGTVLLLGSKVSF